MSKTSCFINNRRAALPSAILLALLGSAQAAQATTAYTFNNDQTTLGLANGGLNGQNYGYGINNSNVIAGGTVNNDTGLSLGFAGSTAIDYPGAANPGTQQITVVNGINTSGNIIGNYTVGSNQADFYSTPAAYGTTVPTQAIPTDPTHVTSTVTVQSQAVTGITDNNLLVGWSTLSDNSSYIFEFNTSNKSFTDLALSSLPSAATSGIRATGVSSDGTYIVGNYMNGTGTDGFVLNTVANTFTTIHDLNAAGLAGTFANGVNKNGVVVGSFQEAGNNSNDVAGFTFDAKSGTFLNDNIFNAAHPANDPKNPNYWGGAYQTQLNGINDNGLIVGVSGGMTFTATAVSAVPLPGAVWLFGSALMAGLYNGKRRKAI